MTTFVRILVVTALLACLAALWESPAQQNPGPPPSFLGYDLNYFPGDDALPILRKTFSFGSYWLSPPPGEKQSTWLGKRKAILQQGFGFLVLFNAKESRQVKTQQIARALGSADAQRAAKLATQEGFPPSTIIFLDVEEGGRLSDAFHVYVQSWFKTLAETGFRPGVYCSGIPVSDGPGAQITTAQDIQAHSGSKKIAFWVYNDACPPSPGCTFPNSPPSVSASGTDFAAIWQYAQSPMRKEFAAHCPPNYAPDGNCYAPGDVAHKWFLDANVASTPDPSSAK